MNILIDIGHPAHVHYYRNMALGLEQLGHSILWTVKDLPIAKRLLDSFGFSYTVFPKKSDNLFGKIFKQIIYDFLLIRFCLKHNIDLAIGTSVSVAHASLFLKTASIVFDDDDDDVQPMVTKFVNPYVDALLSPDTLKGKRKRQDTIYYAGYHELAYLHPKHFTPDPLVLSHAGLSASERFFIMRFNAFKAHHDIGINGLSLAQKLELVRILEPHGRVLITSERTIEPELANYQLSISPEKMHSLMFFATICIGDSQTMSSEAAVLGTPSLRCNSFAGRISYLEEEEHRYGLTFSFKPDTFPAMVVKLKELLEMPDLKEVWKQRRQKMLADKIDVTDFWTWFIANYPQSKEIVQKDPNHQFRFK